MAARRRRRHLRRVPRVVRHALLRLLPAAAADPASPDRARRRLRVPRQAATEERWQRNWEHAIFWASLLPAFLWGVAFANIVRGVPLDARPRVRRHPGRPAQPVRAARRAGDADRCSPSTARCSPRSRPSATSGSGPGGWRAASACAAAVAAGGLPVWTQARQRQRREPGCRWRSPPSRWSLALAANARGPRGLGVRVSGTAIVARRRDALPRAVPGRHAVHARRRGSLTVDNASSTPVHAEDHDLGRGASSPRSCCSTRAGRTGCSASGSARSTSRRATELARETARPAAAAVRPGHARLPRRRRSALGAAAAGLVVAQAMLLADDDRRRLPRRRRRSPTCARRCCSLARRRRRARRSSPGCRSVAAHRASRRGEVAAAGPAAGARRCGSGRAGWPGERSGELATLATRGVDALDDYFSRYLPQLVLAVVVPGGRAGARIAARRLGLGGRPSRSTLPLIPVFMVAHRLGHPGARWTGSGGCSPGCPATSSTSSPGCRR